MIKKWLKCPQGIVRLECILLSPLSLITCLLRCQQSEASEAESERWTTNWEDQGENDKPKQTRNQWWRLETFAQRASANKIKETQRAWIFNDIHLFRKWSHKMGTAWCSFAAVPEEAFQETSTWNRLKPMLWTLDRQSKSECTCNS